MKIIYISNFFIPSKAANSIQIMKMCGEFSKLKNEVTLFCKIELAQYELEEIWKYYGVAHKFKLILIQVFKVPGIGALYFYLKWIIHLIINNKSHIIVGRSLYGLFIANMMGYRTIYESHALLKGFFRRIFESYLLNSERNIKTIVISESLKMTYLKR